jgi:hypothetical protein
MPTVVDSLFHCHLIPIPPLALPFLAYTKLLHDQPFNIKIRDPCANPYANPLTESGHSHQTGPNPAAKTEISFRISLTSNTSRLVLQPKLVDTNPSNLSI